LAETETGARTARAATRLGAIATRVAVARRAERTFAAPGAATAEAVKALMIGSRVGTGGGSDRARVSQ